MFLRATKRFKDGKVHYYWSMVENVRVGRRVFRIARGVRQARYLGELNDSQREEWQCAIEPPRAPEVGLPSSRSFDPSTAAKDR